MSAESETQRALGAAIKGARERADMLQKELAHESGLDITYVCSVERGKRNLTIASLLKISKALGVLPSTLLKRAGA
ncbi:helix-turn-helix domain-containing protein [Pelagicoccus enzymogenes]|uniref:helix-turn-helix domain-containing protein n=1 Tax=Pelagicoccus enzymogenes TaxID=2773457 RepID=UPI002811C4F2|nr:helix-turn-helix transcriptional regulator [Pelagicoccus enzymogenes]